MDWVSTASLLEQTGLSELDAEAAYSNGFFLSAETTINKPFMSMIFHQPSIDDYHIGKESRPMLSERHVRFQKEGADKLAAQKKLVEEQKLNKANITELWELKIEQRELKQTLGV